MNAREVYPYDDSYVLVDQQDGDVFPFREVLKRGLDGRNLSLCCKITISSRKSKRKCERLTCVDDEEVLLLMFVYVANACQQEASDRVLLRKQGK